VSHATRPRNRRSTGWDAKFRELTRAENIRASVERLSTRPQHFGSAYDKDNAEWILVTLAKTAPS